MRKHRLGKQLLIALCVVLLVFLAGCRPSPVLEQIIYEQNHEIDKDLETKSIDNDPENEEEDDTLPSQKTVDEAEQTKDQEYKMAVAGDVDSDPDAPLDAVSSLIYSPYGYYSEPAETTPTADSTAETATGSTKSGGSKGGGDPSAVGGGSGNGGESGGESGGGTSAGGEATDEGTPAGNEQAGGGNGSEEDDDIIAGDEYQDNEVPPDTEKEIVDDKTGETVKPVVGSRVTAVGEAATIVEMLGSEGQLVGTSSSFYDSLAQQVFADKGASEVPVWWDGDGSDPCDEFDALLEAHPDVCFEISQQDTFSDAQHAALTEAGITYMPLPQLNSIENIEEAVTIVGEVLGNHASEGGTDAESKASDYCAWADNVISLSQTGAGSAKYTTYISRWDSDAYWKIYLPSSSTPLRDGYGAPVGMQGTKSTPLNECMGYANLSNRGRDNVYVDPVKPVYWLSSVTGETAKTDSQSPAFGYLYRLGLENYPAVIAADNSIAEKMLSGDYYECHWQVGYDIQVGSTVAFGFHLDGDGGTPVQTYIEDNYWIYVNPSGVGSWANGSVESPLEAAWLTCKLQNGISESDMQSMVSDFYRDFYGTTENVPDVSEGYYIVCEE